MAWARITTNISKTTKVSSTTKNKWHASSSRPKRKADTATPRLAAPRITVTQPISKKIAREPPHQLLRSYHASNIETHVRTYIMPFMCLCIFVSGCLHVFLEIHTCTPMCSWLTCFSTVLTHIHTHARPRPRTRSPTRCYHGEHEK